ncbi:hypothetical protein PTSG_08850 [Salpingoeca rosetta]|uniref:Uncharacterized protein n=1 Tax=Salpingoeca rosetta (strain ATCC 50818 / BSB-021) TaxID=946362 RepID=F2UKW2_SALR5|nr:uncharacterized protein PTSG_08850 [Salpingoeca rosetta]EGD77761.1 hypothetical protein PTSG_08850 [Salpingoeca rosetta]|eukprot:XP_004990237.1 hypothetical protein PTSG_08850 [Salpingoeca rosetta]
MQMKCTAVLAALLLVGCVGHMAVGMQLLVDPKNPLRATGNGTAFDISSVLKYPALTTGPGFNPPIYKYHFDPHGLDCDNQGKAVVCQDADFPRNCGHPDSAIWMLHQMSPLKLTILYVNGFNWRATNMTFVEDPKQTKTQFNFVSESPYLQYNFVVSGSDVGKIMHHLDDAHLRHNATNVY